MKEIKIAEKKLKIVIKINVLKFIVLLVNSEASKSSTNTKGVIFIKAELNDVSSVTSGGLHQVKAEHNAHRI